MIWCAAFAGFDRRSASGAAGCSNRSDYPFLFVLHAGASHYTAMFQQETPGTGPFQQVERE